MIATIALILAHQDDLPKTFDDLIVRMDKAYRELTNYADIWDLTDDGQPDTTIRYTRQIDGKRSCLRVSVVRPSKSDEDQTPIGIFGANGREVFVVAFPTKSYSVVADDGSYFKGNGPTHTESGGFKLAVSNFGFQIACKPMLQLKSVEPVEGGVKRLATAEAFNPETKNSLTVQMTFLNRCWLLIDLTANLLFADGKQEVIKLHPRSVLMGAKLPAKGFDLDRSTIKGFAKKSADLVIKDLEQSLRHASPP